MGRISTSAKGRMVMRTEAQNKVLRIALVYLGNKHAFDLRTVKNILHGVQMTALALDAESTDLTTVNSAARNMHTAAVMRMTK